MITNFILKVLNLHEFPELSGYMIATELRWVSAHKGGKYGGICGEEEGNADYGVWCNPVSNILHHV